MKLKQYSLLLLLAIMPSVFLFAGEPDDTEPDDIEYLHKRTFRVSMSEVRNGKVARKIISDEFYFKNGKIHSDFLHEKFGHKYIRYRVLKDTIFTDYTNTEVRQLVIRAVVTDENNKTILMNFTTTEWDIDGTIKVTKNDKLRRTYDFAGREKGGKPKKTDRAPVIEAIVDFLD